MTLGAWNYAELRSSYHHWLTQTFFVLFLILVPILLLNMLIAMMGNTYSEISEKSEREFALQWANILVEIERALPKSEACRFVDQYTIVSRDPENPMTTLMVRGLLLMLLNARRTCLHECLLRLCRLHTRTWSRSSD